MKRCLGILVLVGYMIVQSWSQCSIETLTKNFENGQAWPSQCTHIEASHDDQRTLCSAIWDSDNSPEDKIQAYRAMANSCDDVRGSHAYLYRYLGNSYFFIDDYGQAADAFAKAHGYCSALPSSDSTLHNITLVNSGITSFYAGRIEAAKDRIRLALENERPLSTKSRANCLGTLAEIALQEGNLGLAEEYYEAAGLLHIQRDPDSIAYIEYSLNPIATGYSEFAQYHRALKITENALDILSRKTPHEKNSSTFILLENNRAAYALELFQFDKAQKILENLIQDFSTAELSEYLNNIYLNLANCYQINGAYHQADSILQLLPKKEGQSAKMQQHISSHRFQYLRKTKKFQAANELLDSIVRKNTSFGIAQLPNVLNELSATAISDAIRVYSNLAVLYADIYSTSKDEAAIDTSWYYATVANHAIEQLRLQLLDPAFTQDLTARSDALMEETVLYILAQKPDEYRRLYPFIEKARATSLLYAMKRSSEIELPDEIVELGSKIKSIDEKIFEVETQNKATDETLYQLQQERINYLRKKNVAMENLAIFQSVVEPPTLTDIQGRLEDDASMVYYFIAKDSLVIFQIRHDDVILTQRPLYPAFQKDLQTVRVTSIKNKPSQQAWSNANNRLSTLLIHGIFNKNDRRVIIIPSGVLISFPYECLTTSTIELNQSYRSMPLVLKQLAISYNFSASIWTEMENKKAKGKGLLFMLPTFSSSNEATEFISLPGAEMEVQRIRDSWRGKSIVVKTKQPFLVQAPNHRLIHFAGHAHLDGRDPRRSYLAFSSESTSADRLRMYEVYDMELHCDLVALSACNTGSGAIKKGEGVLSLTRAFASAGAKSLLYSLWAVSDKTTAELMERFYAHMDKGRPKDTALQLAKLDYMEEAPDQLTHPYFWAGFLAMGDMQSVSSFRPNRTWPIIALFVLGNSYLLYRRFRRRKR